MLQPKPVMTMPHVLQLNLMFARLHVPGITGANAIEDSSVMALTAQVSSLITRSMIVVVNYHILIKNTNIL